MGSYVSKTDICRQQLRVADQRGHPIVYCDETLFTRHTYMLSEYSRKKESLQADARDFYLAPAWVIAFVEAERGVVHYASYSDNLDGWKFLGYCREVSTKMGGQPFTLFLDGASFHRSRDIAQELEALGITRIINAPYSPQFNPIEGCFSIVKNHFKRKRLHDIVSGEPTLT